jgi:hypothetical protein
LVSQASIRVEEFSWIHDVVRIPSLFGGFDKSQFHRVHELGHVFFTFKPDAVFAADLATQVCDNGIEVFECLRFYGTPYILGMSGFLTRVAWRLPSPAWPLQGIEMPNFVAI